MVATTPAAAVSVSPRSSVMSSSIGVAVAISMRSPASAPCTQAASVVSQGAGPG
jgi:hypothetical protein